MAADRMHELLPWYVNGTLSSEEKLDFERHVANCESCLEELGVVEKIKAGVERHGEAFLADHPPPEELVALHMPGEERLEAARASSVQRHLALCVTCSEESRWLRGEASSAAARPEHSEAAQQVRSASIPRRPQAPAVGPWDWRFVWRWGATAAAAVLLAAVFMNTARGPRETGVIAPPYRIVATERSSEGRHEIRLDPRVDALRLFLEVDLGPAAYPLTVELEGPEGRIVHRRAGVAAEHLLDGRFLFLEFPRKLIADGKYMVLVKGSGPSAERPTEYPFNVVTGTTSKP